MLSPVENKRINVLMTQALAKVKDTKPFSPEKIQELKSLRAKMEPLDMMAQVADAAISSTERINKLFKELK